LLFIVYFYTLEVNRWYIVLIPSMWFIWI